MSETHLQAFVDSGVAGNFLDAGLANKLALPLVPLEEPLPNAAINGRSLAQGDVSHQTHPVSPHTEHIALFIIHAPDLQLILGYPWFQRHSPQVDWLSQLVLSWGSICQTSCLQPPKPLSGAGHNPNGPDLFRVPQEYWDFREAFSKQKAQLLPPHLPYDMAINLLPGSSPLRGHLVSLSGPKHQATDEYIQEVLALEFLRPSPSASPAGMEFFFGGKKDGGLCPCIDYWVLNKMTVKDHYPLPLMTSAFEALQ
ncbi:hypothetical protein P4O66_002291 [Electrophorus voltai]|uniref:Uncharacterized protein n=1 Tax=Electrophorus voltai TaxID=2609070 RepID=A0AAD8YZ28_9TELE|nr:hypothetical protein P4O66_002291 [Electrophorus voltai]